LVEEASHPIAIVFGSVASSIARMLVSGMLELNSKGIFNDTLTYLILSGMGVLFVGTLIFGMKDVVNEEEFVERRIQQKNSG